MELKRLLLVTMILSTLNSIHGSPRSIMMSIFNDQKYQCADQSCISIQHGTVSSLHHCQTLCLAHASCFGLLFEKSTKICKLYDESLKLNNTLIPAPDAVAMLVTLDERSISGEWPIYSFDSTFKSI